jgi:hypothetical protein
LQRRRPPRRSQGILEGCARAEVDTTKTIELEQKYDPEMRFRPLVPPATLVVGGTADRVVVLPLLHRGFGLLRETTHRGIHLAFVLGLVFLVFPARKSMLEHARRHSWWTPGGVPLFDWLLGLAIAASVLYIPWIFEDLAFRVGNPLPIDVGDGVRPRRAVARGHAARDGVAAAGDRDRVHGLRARRAGFSGSAQAFGRAMVEPRQPPLHDEPGHLRDCGRCRRDVRVPLRAVRRARNAIGLGQLFIDIASAIAGRYAGGPAKVSVFASALFGMLSGSSVANAVTVGSLTIPR